MLLYSDFFVWLSDQGSPLRYSPATTGCLRSDPRHGEVPPRGE